MYCLHDMHKVSRRAEGKRRVQGRRVDERGKRVEGEEGKAGGGEVDDDRKRQTGEERRKKKEGKNRARGERKRK